MMGLQPAGVINLEFVVKNPPSTCNQTIKYKAGTANTLVRTHR